MWFTKDDDARYRKLLVDVRNFIQSRNIDAIAVDVGVHRKCQCKEPARIFVCRGENMICCQCFRKTLVIVTQPFWAEIDAYLAAVRSDPCFVARCVSLSIDRPKEFSAKEFAKNVAGAVQEKINVNNVAHLVESFAVGPEVFIAEKVAARTVGTYPSRMIF